MEKKEVHLFLIKYKSFLAALLLLFITTVFLQVNYNKNKMDNYTVDEYFTITSIHPNLTPDKMVHRALNGPRLFTYLFYPGALIGMINHQGGNIYEDGWDYPGHHYFVENYQTRSSSIQENMHDPNFRYLHYYLKLQAVIFMFLSMLPILFLLWKNNSYMAVFMVSTMIGLNLLMLEQRSLFYIEPLLVSMMNLLTWLYFFIAEKKQLSRFWLVFSALLFAITISLKFSSLFLIALIFILIISKHKTLEQKLIASFILVICSLGFFCIINWDMFYSKVVFNEMVHDYFSNFWQYATGNKGYVFENNNMQNFKRTVVELFYSLGGTIYLFPIILFFGLKLSSKFQLKVWGAFTFSILLSIFLIIKQKVYIDRNILPFLPAIVIITGVMLDNIVRKIASTEFFKKKDKLNYLYVFLALIVFIPIISQTKNYFKTIFPSAKENIEKTLYELPRLTDSRLIMTDFPFEIDKSPFSKVVFGKSAPQTNGNNFKNFIKETLISYESEDIVLISEVKNNKQLTNYLLPQIYDSNKQFSNYFLFYNRWDRLEPEDKKVLDEFYGDEAKSIHNGAVLIREDMYLKQVKISKRKNGFRIYFKIDQLNSGNEDWEGCRFYFHGIPSIEDVNNLPDERKKYGFEGWDFTVKKDNYVKYGKSLYLFHDFEPSLKNYEEFSFGIFRGCTKSKDFSIYKVKL